LGLAQIYPIWDEDTDEERLAVSASFADPYLAILRDDASLLLLQADDSGDLDEVSLPDDLSSLKWRSACLYRDNEQVFSSSDSKSTDTADENIILFLLSTDYKLSVSCPGESDHSNSSPDCGL
jgi:cleavage and polyadenylation specificity factor subunit 1